MHIAICDDNTPDRKQLERLLKRESDLRGSGSGTGIFYTDSYGNADRLLSNPMSIDVFFIDMCLTPGTDALSIVSALTELGVNKPIILCSGAVDYTKIEFPCEVLHLKKPILKADLSAVLDVAAERCNNAEHLVELREETNTHYVSAKEILYAVSSGKYHSLVTLTDHSTILIRETPETLFSEVEQLHSCFAMPSDKVMINMDYIVGIDFFHKAEMTDGTKFRLPRFLLDYLKDYLKANE